jgi:sugar phosphate isomerase/epimerase
MPTGLVAHVQLNDRNRRGPGQGEDRFTPILAALQRTGYDGWLAMEPFDYVPDGPTCAARSIGYVAGILEGLR